MEIHAKLVVPVNQGGRRGGGVEQKMEKQTYTIRPKKSTFFGVAKWSTMQISWCPYTRGTGKIFGGEGAYFGFFSFKKAYFFSSLAKNPT